MRRVYVGAPSLNSRLELSRRQKAVSSADDARSSWNRYRGSAQAREIIRLLKDAAGVRMRCFYCSDSLAADVDHFVPISVNFKNAFSWRNFIWVCPVCNRCKGKRFPLDPTTASPLLINPTREDPWIYFILDTDTGVLAPRYRVDDFDIKGTVTLKILAPINYEPATEGRKRVVERIREAVSSIPNSDSSPKDICNSLRRLLREVRQDDYGVAAWFGLWDGKTEREFQDLSVRNAAAWRRFVQYCATTRYGGNLRASQQRRPAGLTTR